MDKMTFDNIESVLRIEFVGEMKGLGQALELMEQCVFYCETDQKNYVNGDQFMSLVRDRKKLLLNRFERGCNY